MADTTTTASHTDLAIIDCCPASIGRSTAILPNRSTRGVLTFPSTGSSLRSGPPSPPYPRRRSARRGYVYESAEVGNIRLRLGEGGEHRGCEPGAGNFTEKVTP